MMLVLLLVLLSLSIATFARFNSALERTSLNVSRVSKYQKLSPNPGFPGFKVRRYKAGAFAPRSPDVVTYNVLEVTSYVGTSNSRKYIQALAAHESKRSLGHSVPISSAAKDNVYLVPIKFGDQSFFSVVDTGSSDTWLVNSDFDCIDLFDRTVVPETDCRFGPLYNTSSTFEQIPDRHFNISYADGEFLNGIMGREKVSLAGLTVPRQTVGVVDYAAWMGDTQSSGLIGLAYPSITRAYAGNSSMADRKGLNIAYSPIFTSMVRQNLTAPLFSLALGRDGKPGVLAFGGLPGYPIRYDTNFAKAGIEFLSLTAGDETLRSQAEYQMYTISTDGFTFSERKVILKTGTPKPVLHATAARTQVIIDSGTTLLFLPANITEQINSLWHPPARYNELSQTYFVQCNASAPRFGVLIDGQTFWVNPKDLIQDAGIGTRICMSGIQPGNEGVSVLGDVFLKSVLAVFDVGAGEMRFAARR